MARHATFLALAGLAACGELVAVESGTPPAADAGNIANGSTPDVANAIDSGPIIPPLGCNPSAPFGGATLLVTGTGESANTVGAGTPGVDALTLLFTSNADEPGNQTDFRVYVATRGAPSGAFLNPIQAIPGQGDGSHANDPFLGELGVFLWTKRANNGSPFHIERGRLNTDHSLAVTDRISLDDDDGDSDAVQPHAVGSSLYFARNSKRNRSAYTLWHATLDEDDDAYGVAPLDIDGIELARAFAWKPVVSGDELTLWFALGTSFTDTTIVVSKRERKDRPWGTPVSVDELNQQGKAQAPTWVSPDGCQIWFESNKSADGKQLLYVATRPK